MYISKNLKNHTHIAGILLCLIFSLTAVTVPSLAHDTFLLPAKHKWSVGNNVDIKLSSALSFPDLTSGPKRNRIASTFIRVGGEPVNTFSLTESKAFLTAGFKAERAGFGVVAMSSKPRFGDIEPEKAEEYFDEIGASEPVRQAFAALPGEPPLHRSYAKHTKTFVCVENCVAGNSASSAPVGQALEFVAVDGGANTFQLLRGGKPLAHHKVKISTSAKDVYEVKTTENGELTVDGKVSGVIMLLAVVITLPDQPDGVYHSDYASLVLEITQAP